MDFALSDEQNDFVDAIRNFCDRECGTQDQRERLRRMAPGDVYDVEIGWYVARKRS